MTPATVTSGAHKRHLAAERSRRRHAEAAEIGEIPAVRDSDRRLACERDLLLYLTTYFPASTGLRLFSDDHERVIGRTQRCILGGGRFANIVYRGFAKTSIVERAALWATSYGHRRFVPIFASDRVTASEILDSIKAELEDNPLLHEDFPEICRAVASLEGKPQRAASQTHNGELTHLVWTSSTLVLPRICLPGDWMPGVAEGTLSPSAGAIIRSKGLLAASRGMKHALPDGTQQRPDMVLLDDPQTDASAASPVQTQKRLNIIKRAILKLSGHDKSLAVVLNCNIVHRDDLPHQIANRPENKAWQSEVIPMVRKWSDAHESHWMTTYKDLRTNYDPRDPDDQSRAHREATAFYVANRAAMDAGCQVSWDECYDRDLEVSAIQHAYNMLIDDGPDVFASEAQNDPIEEADTEGALQVDQVLAKLNKRKRGIIPASATVLTAGVDLHDDVFFWTVTAWAKNFAGDTVDYNTFPQQPQAIFTLKDAKVTITAAYPGKGKNGRIQAALCDLTNDLLGRTWHREDGQTMQIALCGIDSGYLPDLVYEAIRLSDQSTRLIATRGRGIGATGRPMREYTYAPGETKGHYWGIFRREKRTLPTLDFDANYWKSRIRDGYGASFGDPGCISLFGDNPAGHQLFAAHLTAEKPTTVEANGRRVEEWRLLVARDNHWLDTQVIAAVTASVQGIAVPGTTPIEPAKKKERKSLQQLAAEAGYGRR